jgi:hypothetical protein
MASKAKTAEPVPPAACPCGENADIAPKTAGPDGPTVSRCRRCGQIF